ncbi:hypothetical protein JHK87_020591 [Glycine soja]|nr:hypothetical protein JHK87_020591 [Glycine soja]
MDNASLAISPFLPSKDFLHEYCKVERESIARLKMSLMKESGNGESTEKKGFTNFETLAAYIWRSRTRALKLSYDGETMLIIIVGVRPRLQDPLSRGYTGMPSCRHLLHWRHLAMLEKVDFGWKEAVNSMPVPCGFVQDPAS